MEWITHETVETFGDVSLRIHALKNLESTIDELFEELNRKGDPNLLEELCPYFGCVWPAARALSEFLSRQNLEKVGAQRFLEVGCGLAIPSMILMKKTRLSKVVATDFHPEVPKFLERNLQLNFTESTDRISERFLYRNLDWRNPNEVTDRFHWVVGSDILYEKAHPREVAEALTSLVKPLGRITVADPARPYLQVFVDEMKARGWSADPVVTQAKDSQGVMKEVFLFDFLPKGVKTAPLW